MSNEPEKPKIIIDEDWKSQVAAEKAAAQAASSTSTASSSEAPAQSQPAEHREGLLPPATFSFLLTTIATQAMIALGQVPNPITGKVEIRPQQAKHYIDTLAMLEEKTTGNRTPEESTLLTEVLHQLRMGFVMTKSSQATSQN